MSKRPVWRSSVLLARVIALRRSSRVFGQCSERISGNRSLVSVSELVCEVVSTSLGELKSRRVSLALELLDNLSPVRADRIQLQQVLLNLLTNAVDSMASITDRPHVLRVRSERLEDWALNQLQISARGSIRNMLNACSKRSLRPNQTALGWVCLSVVR